MYFKCILGFIVKAGIAVSLFFLGLVWLGGWWRGIVGSSGPGPCGLCLMLRAWHERRAFRGLSCWKAQVTLCLWFLFEA